MTVLSMINLTASLFLRTRGTLYWFGDPVVFSIMKARRSVKVPGLTM